jgi:uncharacterized protein YneF (UPF0154 family)
MGNGTKVALLIGGVLLLLGGIAGGIYFYRQMNYKTITAEVESAEDMCLMRHSGGRRGSSRELGPMDCDEADRMRESRDYLDYKIQEISLIRVSYRSPADDRMHEGEIRAFPDTYRDVRRGDEIDIRAHTSEADVILATDAL